MRICIATPCPAYWMIVIFGVLGYLFEKFKFPISRTVLGAIVGPVSETAFMPS